MGSGALGEASDEGVPHEGIGVWVVGEEEHGMVEVTIGGGGTES